MRQVRARKKAEDPQAYKDYIAARDKRTREKKQREDPQRYREQRNERERRYRQRRRERHPEQYGEHATSEADRLRDKERREKKMSDPMEKDVQSNNQWWWHTLNLDTPKYQADRKKAYQKWWGNPANRAKALNTQKERVRAKAEAKKSGEGMKTQQEGKGISKQDNL